MPSNDESQAGSIFSNTFGEAGRLVSEGKVYGSARDAGNYGAGYVAGKEGLNFWEARLGFGALESLKSKSFTREGPQSRLAQKLGWTVGKKRYDSVNKYPPR